MPLQKFDVSPPPRRPRRHPPWHVARTLLARRIPDREVLRREVDAWQSCRNRDTVRVDWRFTTADARIGLKSLCPINTIVWDYQACVIGWEVDWSVRAEGSEVLAVRAILVLIAVGLIITTTTWADGAGTSLKSKSGMALPGEKCRISAADIPKSWNQAEIWAWREICEGRNADFNKRLKETLDPRDPDHDLEWLNENRALSSDFLRTILLYEPFRGATSYRGVYIVGAYFQDDVDLNHAPIERPLVFLESVFNGSLFLSRFATSSFILFEGSKLRGKLIMDSASIGGSLLMRGSKFDEVVLRDARLGGQLAMMDSTFKGQLDMNVLSTEGSLHMQGSEFDEVDLIGAKIGDVIAMDGSTFKSGLNMDAASSTGSLFMRKAKFDEVILRGARIGGQLSMVGSTFNGRLNMDAALITGRLLMGSARFGEVILRGARIGGQLSMAKSAFRDRLMMDSVSVGSNLLMGQSGFDKVVLLAGANIGHQLSMVGSIFKDELDMEGASVGGDLFMQQAKFDKPVKLIFVSVGSNLSAVRAVLRGLDLTGAQIAEELRIGSSDLNIEWRDHIDRNGDSFGPKLTLQNASVGVLQDTAETWPDYLQRELEGFTYDRLGGFQLQEQEMAHRRGSDWYIKWLEKDTSYSPQPYQHLAHVLRSAGHEIMANDILFASRERERAEFTLWQSKWWGLSVLRITIGYGYGSRHFLALVWVALLVLIGVGVLWKYGECGKDGKRLGFWYSLDMLLPVIHLREQHYKVDLASRWAKYYFYVHKVAGYILTFFVAAGLTGLTR